MKPIRNDLSGTFARMACDMAERLRREGVAAPAVGVVVNRVDLARAIFERLSETDAPFDCLLLIGRSRDVDRREIESKLDPFRTGNDEERAAAAPLMVVATQCLEVGVDLDLDGLVTEAAPLDALRQRFGRVNRAGRPIEGRGGNSDHDRERGEEDRRSDLRGPAAQHLGGAIHDRHERVRRLRGGCA